MFVSTRHLSVLWLALLLAVSIEARSAEPSSHPSNTLDSDPQQGRSAGGVFGELRSVYQIYKDCSGAEVSSCLKLKLLSTMERVSRSAQLNIVEGVTLVKDEQAASQPEEPIRSPQEIEASLPRSLEDKEDALNSMILDKAVGFLQSHTLKVKLPNVEELQRSLSEEGRGKKRKGMGGLLAIPLLIGGTLVPLALGTLALLAGKALIVSKLALVLASIIGLKKLVSSHDHGHHEVHSGGGWARAGQDLAYSAYKPIVPAAAS
ncbi:osiris 8 precursor [Nasonia vitripennis]|uniref:Osiris 8 n=1 Tax=Nasonia vitripennis TaxID=7425 RepID=A0A7M6UFZ5_NASVI|nr:osiris 8 precursor [Nasonia vitripennis]